jgi:hypothetical protein
MVIWRRKVIPKKRRELTLPAILSLSQQNLTTSRCKDAIYIGRAVDHKGSITLRHVDTKRPVVRYSFKVLGQNNSISHALPELDIQLGDDHNLPDLHYNHLTGQVSTRPVAEILQQDGSTYMPVSKSKLAKSQLIYFTKLNQYFVDSSSGLEYKIVGIDFQIRHQGKPSPHPKTPLFKHYDTSLHIFAPRDDGDYEWISCSELLRDSTTVWNTSKNSLSAYSAELNFNFLSRTINDHNSEFSAYLPILRQLSASRVSVLESPPRKFSDLAKHPEGQDHLASFLREVESFHTHGMLLPPTIDIHDIPAELILQLMPIWSKKFEGLDFSKFKCRMVGLGNRWKNIFGEATTSGMANMETVKAFLTVCAASGSVLSKIDHETAFLQAKLSPSDHPYYLRAPPGVPSSIMPHISQPEAYVYGHPKAGRQFEKKYRTFLLDNGWIASSYDRYSFSLSNDLGTASLLTIVDDSPIMSSSIAMRDFVHSSIGSQFKITIDLECKHIAGIDVQKNSNFTYTLRQNGACEDLFDSWIPNWRSLDINTLPRTPMSSTSRAAPLSPAAQLSANKICSPQEVNDLQSQLGLLNWLTHTWPDILFAYKEKSICAAHANHHDAYEISRIIKYMVNMYRTNNFGLTVGGTLGVHLLATVDTAFAPNIDLKSHTGGTIHMGPQYGSFSSFSSRQTIMADSSTSAEGVGCHMLAKILLPLRFYLAELFHPSITATRICMDIVPYLQSALGEKGHSKRNKHVLIRMKIVNEAISNDEVSLEHLRTIDMVSDILTKPLGPLDFHRLRRVLLGMDPVKVPFHYIRDPKLHCHYLRFL